LPGPNAGIGARAAASAAFVSTVTAVGEAPGFEFVKELSDEVIDVHLAYGPRVPHVSSVVHLYPIDWVREYHSALSAYSAGGGYVNFLMEEGQERVAASYRDNYQRLVQVKSAYDPANLFRVNQNIRPRSR
jgi:hypothetical protein